jgi:hypothetical protein
MIDRVRQEGAGVVTLHGRTQLGASGGHGQVTPGEASHLRKPRNSATAHAKRFLIAVSISR